MRKGDVFKSKYLKQTDVPLPVRATIKRVRLEVISADDDAEEKPVLEFAEPHIKPMIVNLSNWSILEAAFGDSDAWKSKTIVIVTDPTVMYRGQQVGGLRVKIPRQKQPATPAAPLVQADWPDPSDETEAIEAEAY